VNARRLGLRSLPPLIDLYHLTVCPGEVGLYPFAHSFHGFSASGRKLLERLSLRYDLRYDLWPTQFVKG
jgi:hypothetical protein